jgi:Uma2 family endonuclease
VHHGIVDSMLDVDALKPERIRPLKRAEYDRLVEAGVFENEKIELLRGMLVAMSPHGDLHAWLVERLNHLFVAGIVRLGVDERFSVRPALPYAASDDSEPEPDVAIVPPRGFGEPHPQRAFLLIEVADSSLRKDRRIKRSIYAEAGVPEYWIVDVDGRAVEVYREPRDGDYQSMTRVTTGNMRPVELPELEIALVALFPVG